VFISSPFYTDALENEREFQIKFMYILVIRMIAEEVNTVKMSLLQAMESHRVARG
jgi:hypothetical protein